MEILKHLNTSDDYTKLSDMLFYSIVNMTPISNNAMLDGFNIGLFIDLKKIIIPIIENKEYGGKLCDGTIQKVETCLGWLDTNKDEILKRLNK